MGMGFDVISTSGVSTVFTNMYNQNEVALNVFSFWFDRYLK
jgi:hypothetical protein